MSTQAFRAPSFLRKYSEPSDEEKRLYEAFKKLVLSFSPAQPTLFVGNSTVRVLGFDTPIEGHLFLLREKVTQRDREKLERASQCGLLFLAPNVGIFMERKYTNPNIPGMTKLRKHKKKKSLLAIGGDEL